MGPKLEGQRVPARSPALQPAPGGPKVLGTEGSDGAMGEDAAPGFIGRAYRAYRVYRVYRV